MALEAQSTNLRGEVKLLFQRLAQELPAQTANLRVYDVPGGGVSIELTPTNPASATIRVFADDSEVYTFSFGLRSYWEFPFERRYRYDEKSVIAEIEEMSRAVLGGHCEETRGLVSISGRIHVRDYTYKATTLPILRLPWFGTRRYAPYAAQQLNCRNISIVLIGSCSRRVSVHISDPAHCKGGAPRLRFLHSHILA